MEEEVGEVIDFFKKISVAAVRIYPGKSLKLGDRIVIKGPHTCIEQVVDSLQIEHKPVAEAGGGAEVGLLVHLVPQEEGIPNVPREGNKVYKVVE
jgi:putative protease